MTCNHDCFHCPYPDCIEDYASEEELAEINDREREIIRSRAKRPSHVKSEASRERDKVMKWHWRRTHPEEALDQSRRAHAKRVDEDRDYSRRYHATHREELLSRTRERWQQWAAEHPERVAQAAQAWEAANAERLREYQRGYRQAHREEINARNKAYYYRDLELTRAKNREKSRRYRERKKQQRMMELKQEE